MHIFKTVSAIRAKVVLTGFLALGFSLFFQLTAVGGECPPDVVWLYDSRVDLMEEITDLGNGLFLYTYSFENTDSNNIWSLAVFTTFEIQGPLSIWPDHIFWSNWIDNDQNSMLPQFDLRCLDPAIIAHASTWAEYFENTNDPIAPGATVGGFSFIGEVFDNSPKYYHYQTVEEGNAYYTGVLAAVGQTISGSVGTEIGSLGRVKAMYR